MKFQYGINIRHLGHVLQAVKASEQLVHIVVVAMVTRVLKNLLRYQIRSGFETNTQKKAQFLNRNYSNIIFKLKFNQRSLERTKKTIGQMLFLY